MNKQKKTNSEGIGEDEINELKQDLSSFRFELLDILHNNGMTVNNLNANQQSCLTRSFVFLRL